MGIPGLLSWLIRKYPKIIEDCKEDKSSTDDRGVYHPIDETKPNPNRIRFDNLYLDMNQIVQKCAQSEKNQPAKHEEEIIELVFQYLERIFTIIRPRQLVYMAIDGVTPRARMPHQRSKRFLQSKNISDGLKDKFNTNDQDQAVTTDNFDKCNIKPGTEFMSKLFDYLQYYIYRRMNKNPAWHSLKVFLSDANVPGEGEHKIMDFIRRQRAQSDYDPEAHHVVYSSDSDLILLGLAIHQPNLRLLCEICINCEKIGHNAKNCKADKRNQINELPSTASNHMETKYIFVEFSILREHLGNELRIYDSFPFRWDLERAIDDWVFICLLFGNDFLPKSPSVDLSGKRITMGHLFGIYKANVRQFKGYLTENGVANIKRVETFLKSVSEIDQWGKLCSQQYYEEKFIIDGDELEDFPTKVTENYVRGLCWIFQYYYRGPPSWDWYYPYYYAPLAADFLTLKGVSVNFENNTEPFSPFEQMMATFSPQNVEYLPCHWQPLMLEKESLIINFYPKNFIIDPNDKYYKSEYVALLPFIDEKHLLQTLKDKNVYSTLTPEEEKRNRRDYDCLFVHSTNSCYRQFKELYSSNGNTITKDKPIPVQTTANQRLAGYVWPDDNENTIGTGETQAPILNNQVMCVKYRAPLLGDEHFGKTVNNSVRLQTTSVRSNPSSARQSHRRQDFESNQYSHRRFQDSSS